MRKPHVNHERWLISYADFITLLFAFFVVMFAVSQSDRAKARQVSDSIRRAIEEGGLPATMREAMRAPTRPLPAAAPAPPAPPAAVPASGNPALAPAMAYLEKQLRDEIAGGKLQIRMDARGVVISLRERGFFPSGGDLIYADAYTSMSKIAEVLRGIPNTIRLEGHTDAVPIHNGRFRNNWELSAARGVAVLEFFEQRYQISSRRFAVAGYADNLPVADNETEDGRARNRRVDIVILKDSANLQTEAP